MSADRPAQTLSALALLTDPGQDRSQVTSHSLLSAQVAGNLGALDRLPQITREAAAREVTDAATGLLDVSLIGALVAAWRAHHDLTSAARHTLAVPDSTELVRLAEHQITTTMQPYVAVLVDGYHVATLQLDLSLIFDVTAVLAGVRDGHLVALHSGRCDVTATLAVDGSEVTSKQARLQLPGAVPLDPGIRLLPATAYAADAEHAESPDDNGRAMSAVREDTVQIPAIR